MGQDITVSWIDLAAALEAILERTPTFEEIQKFKEYLEIDVGTWINENARTFVRDKLESQ